MFATLTPWRRVIAAPADDVGDARVALPPALVRSGQSTWLPGSGSNDRVASGDGADAHGPAGHRHVPDLVRRSTVAPKHEDLADVGPDAVANAHHLRPAACPIRHRDMDHILRVPGVGDVDDRRAVLLVVDFWQGWRSRRRRSFARCPVCVVASVDVVPTALLVQSRLV